MTSKHNGHEHVTETPDVSHIRNIDVTHETGDVYVPAIAKFILGLTVMTVAVYLLMWGMFRVFSAQEGRKNQPSPVAVTGERLPPEPRLQSAPGFAEDLAKQAGVKEEGEARRNPNDPLWEIQVLREHWKNTLDHGEKDQSGKVVVIPIEDAKKELLKKGLPTR